MIVITYWSIAFGMYTLKKNTSALTSRKPLGYSTATGCSVIIIPSWVDTEAICLQKFLSWSSLHLLAKQAKAQVLMRAPSWSFLLRMSQEPSRGTKAWSRCPSLIFGGGSTRPPTLTISGLTEVWNSSFKYLLLVCIISWAWSGTINEIFDSNHIIIQFYFTKY